MVYLDLPDKAFLAIQGPQGPKGEPGPPGTYVVTDIDGNLIPGLQPPPAIVSITVRNMCLLCLCLQKVYYFLLPITVIFDGFQYFVPLVSK